MVRVNDMVEILVNTDEYEDLVEGMQGLVVKVTDCYYDNYPQPCIHVIVDYPDGTNGQLYLEGNEYRRVAREQAVL